jgi:predicted DNA-binding transcriptional regulator AlpA
VTPVSVTEEFLTGEVVASALGVSHRTLYRWHRLRKGPPQIKIGRKIYYRADAIRQWLSDLETFATSCN